jgi:preprotein translocase subunit SecA
MHASSTAERPRSALFRAGAMRTQRRKTDDAAAQAQQDAETTAAIRELLALLPEDVVRDLNRGQIELHDPAFLDGLMDHISRQALADPHNGRRLLGKMLKLKKLIARSVRQSDPEAAVSATVTREDERVGRNAPCPCGSGRKYKQCCLRKP